MRRRDLLKGMAVLLATKFLPAEKKVLALPRQELPEEGLFAAQMVVDTETQSINFIGSQTITIKYVYIDENSTPRSGEQSFIYART
jgi:hypothetical protein